jgi:2-iminobutanoate/2-iminopropanoate deaminase
LSLLYATLVLARNPKPATSEEWQGGEAITPPRRRILANYIETKKAPKPGGHYSQAIAVGDHVYVSGSGPFNPKTHEIVGSAIEEQTTQTLKNVAAILRAAGCTPRDVVKVTVFLRNMEDFKAMDSAYRRFFGRHRPARTTVQATLYGEDRLVVIDAIAFRGSKPGKSRKSRNVRKA